MRALVIFLALIILPLSFLKAQQNRVVLPAEMSSASSVSLEDILEEIENQTNYSFVYDARYIDLTSTIKVPATSINLFDLLNYIFKDKDIAYTVVNERIILNKKQHVTETIPNEKKITGTVIDDYGFPIIGANLFIKRTGKGSTTDIDGNFELYVIDNENIHVSYIGYQPMDVKWSGETHLEIQLNEISQLLDEIVITALGIKKNESSLSYASQQLSGEELVRVKDVNMINSLAGKTAGVQINKSSAGIGSSARVVIRGYRSVSGNNQPLYVIDGIPMLNSTNEQAITVIGGTSNAGNRDGGDGISNLNPEDIESINVLKGASAAALYGAQAANGVILITTKKGIIGQQQVHFSSNLVFDSPINLPALQNSYGYTEGSTHSWGKKSELPKDNRYNDYFRTGTTAINSITFTSGNEKVQTYFSYANTTAAGIVDNNKVSKHNFTIRETANFFNNRLTLDGNVNLMKQQIKNRPVVGGFYMNPLVGLYTFPAGMDFNKYKNNYEIFDEERNMPVQNWYTEVYDGFEQNPYWINNRLIGTDNRTRGLAAMSARLIINDYLTIQGRGNIDYIQDNYKQKIYATTSPSIAGINGRYIDYSYQETLLYGDLMALYNNYWGIISLNGAIGASISDNRVNYLRLDSNTATLYFPNVFTISNINMNTSAYIDEQNDARRQIQSLYGTAQLGFRNYLFLDLSLRNDWSSTLAYTPSKNSGYFYPSFGISYLPSRMFTLPTWINHGKIRASWSKVGNDIPIFVSNSVSHIGAGGAPLANDTAPFNNLKPEMSSSYEFGLEWKFLDHRLEFDFTWYKTNTRNQLFRLPSSAGAEYKYFYVNAGNIENKGIEATLGVVPIITPDFKWYSGFNLSRNRNIVEELHPDLTTFVYGDEGFSSSYSMRLQKGGSIGDIFGKAFERDENGTILYAEDGLPSVVGAGNTIKVGNSNPSFLLGWSNALTYKNFSFYFLIDGRFGGDVLSQTQAVMDLKGISKNSGLARDKGYVDLEGVQIKDIQGFYEKIGGRSGVTEYYMYDATNVRLREMSLIYNITPDPEGKWKFLKNAQVSLVGKNLFFFYKKTPFDPDVVLSTGNDNQGIDVFGFPTTRSLGFNIKLTF